jgi:hypothetical protein
MWYLSGPESAKCLRRGPCGSVRVSSEAALLALRAEATYRDS